MFATSPRSNWRNQRFTSAAGIRSQLFFRKNRKDFKYYFLISGGRDLSGRLQRACECQSWFWGGFPFPQQGKGSLQQLWSHCLEGRIVACLVDSVYLNTHPLSLSVSEQEQIGNSVSKYFIFQVWAIDIFLQVQEKNGETFRDLKTDGGDTVRLVVSWYMGYLACNNEGSPNKVIADGVNDASAEE